MKNYCFILFVLLTTEAVAADSGSPVEVPASLSQSDREWICLNWRAIQHEAETIANSHAMSTGKYDERVLNDALEELKAKLAKENKLTVAQVEKIIEEEYQHDLKQAQEIQDKSRQKRNFILSLLVLNVPTYLLIGRIMFGSWENSWDCFSMIGRSEYKKYTLEGQWAGAKVLLFVIWSLSLVAVEYKFLSPWFLE